MNIRSGTITINPTAMSADEALVLSCFLNRERSTALRYTKDTTYAFVNMVGFAPYPSLREKLMKPPFDRIYNIQFTHTLVKRQRHSDNAAYCYDVYGDELGRGAFGAVSDILGTLAWSFNNQLTFSQDIHRVGKLIRQNVAFIKERGAEGINEYVTGQRLPYLHMHKPVLFPPVQPRNDFERIFASLQNEHQEGMVVMRYLPGNDLNKVITPESNSQKRLEVGLAALKALKQVHNAGVVHRDIKPDNMKIEERPSGVYVKWFDLNGSRLAEKQDNDAIYTPFYEAPEVHFRKPQTEASDVFSVACMIARDIFGADENPAKKIVEKLDKLKDDQKISSDAFFKKSRKLHNEFRKKQVASSKKCKFTHLFKGLDAIDKKSSCASLTKQQKKAIQALLGQMASKNPNKRPSLDDAISLFEQILWERRLASVDKALHNNLLHARALAEHANKILHIRSDAPPAVLLISRLQPVIDLLKRDFESIGECSEALKVYTDLIGLDVFAGIHRATDCASVLNEVVNNYQDLWERWLRTKRYLEQSREAIGRLPVSPALSELNHIISWVDKKIAKLEAKVGKIINVDDLSIFNQKISHYLTKLDSALNALDDGVKRLEQEEAARLEASRSWWPSVAAVKKDEPQSWWGYAASVASYVGSFFSAAPSAQAGQAAEQRQSYAAGGR